ncbi:MAG: NAD(P)/FAD-dependent oxidoreductase [Raoultibacter sp.]
MIKNYDFVILGGGHNGLIATAYLAKAGFTTCCLEANDEFGGGTRSGEVTLPGYISDTGGMIHSMIARTPIIQNDELGLIEKYGLEYVSTKALFCSIFPDNTTLVIDPDMDKACENIAKFSEHDAIAYRKFHDYMKQMMKVAAVGSQSPPPPYGSMHSAMYMSPEGREFQRVLNSSAQQIVEEWFESEQVRTTFTRWCTEMMIDPRAIGTATLLYFVVNVHNPDLYKIAGKVNHEYPGSPFPKGGSAKFIQALQDCCTAEGAELFTNAFVDGITMDGDLVKSVTTKNGDEFVANNAVISTINIKHVYQMLGDNAPADEAEQIRHLKYADFSALNQSFALDKIPEFKAGPEVLDAFCIEAAPIEKEYLQTFSSYTLGDFSPKLPLITMPCLLDPTRCPEGHCVVNIYQYAPYNLYGDPQNWVKYKEKLEREVWEFAKSLWTNITDDNILGHWSLTPLEYEQWDPAFLHGDIGHIGLQPSQMYDLRPLVGKGHEYHGEIENLYFLGACSHPGAGIAAASRAGVQKVLEDYGVDFRDVVKKD